jgi:hypothetical protein
VACPFNGEFLRADAIVITSIEVIVNVEQLSVAVAVRY